MIDDQLNDMHWFQFLFICMSLNKFIAEDSGFFDFATEIFFSLKEMTVFYRVFSIIDDK